MMSSITTKKKKFKPKTSSSTMKKFYPLSNTDGTPSWPTNHLKKQNYESKSSNNLNKKVAVLVSTGAFSPIHLGHVQIMEKAKITLETYGWNVVGGYMSPSHDYYVGPKAMMFKTPFANAEHRVKMAELATDEYEWLAVGKWEARNKINWPDFPIVCRDLARHLNTLNVPPTVFYVCGSDHAEKCGLNGWKNNELGLVVVARNGKSIKKKTNSEKYVFWCESDGPLSSASSTKVRNAIQKNNMNDLLLLMKPSVIDYMIKHDLYGASSMTAAATTTTKETTTKETTTKEAKASMTTTVLGINYEGGKAIHKARQTTNCLATYNLQIAMDAPFEKDQIATEDVRNKGRTETQLGASDSDIIRQLLKPLQHAINIVGKNDKNTKLIIQIARGRSSQPFYDNVVKVALKQCNVPFDQLVIYNGYRTANYPIFSSIKSKYVYVNIGMFGRLTLNVVPGTIYSVKQTYVIDPSKTSKETTPIHNIQLLNILNHQNQDNGLLLLPSCHLISIPDTFPFVTPDNYDQKSIMALFNTVLPTSAGISASSSSHNSGHSTGSKNGSKNGGSVVESFMKNDKDDDDDGIPLDFSDVVDNLHLSWVKEGHDDAINGLEGTDIDAMKLGIHHGTQLGYELGYMMGVLNILSSSSSSSSSSPPPSSTTLLFKLSKRCQNTIASLNKKLEDFILEPASEEFQILLDKIRADFRKCCSQSKLKGVHNNWKVTNVNNNSAIRSNDF